MRSSTKVMGAASAPARKHERQFRGLGRIIEARNLELCAQRGLNHRRGEQFLFIIGNADSHLFP